MSPPMVDGAFARWLASRTGQLLVETRADLGYDDPAALQSAGRKVALDVLLTELARWRPADAVLADGLGTGATWSGSGGADRPDRSRAERVWIVNPLDGAPEFCVEGHTGWAVGVALWSADLMRLRGSSRHSGSDADSGSAVRRAGRPGTLTAGAVALPDLHRVLATDYPPAYPPMSLAAATGGPMRIAVGRGRPPERLRRLAGEARAELVPVGSSGARIASVICGEADASVQLVGQYEWDLAGPVAVAAAAGLYASRVDGSPLRCNQADPRTPDLLVCRKDLAAGLVAALREAGGE